MGRSRNNIATEGLSGRIDQFVYRQWFGKTIVGKKPRHSDVVSAAQLNIRLTFKDAVIYAKAALTDIATKLAYKRKAKPGQTAFNMALADFFKLPEIRDIDTGNYNSQQGSSIKIAATDDFKVTAVQVKIEKLNGTLVEEGSATALPDGLHWLYNASVLNGTVTGNIITVTATDMPGHSIVKQKTV